MTVDLDETRRLLREWAAFFRDRPKRWRTFSAEGNWRSPQIWEPQQPRPDFHELRALETWWHLRAIPTPYYRALTWRYCYPWLPIGIPLRALKRRLGYTITLKEYDQLVQNGEYALAVRLYNESNATYSAPAPRAQTGYVRAKTQADGIGLFVPSAGSPQ